MILWGFPQGKVGHRQAFEIKTPGLKTYFNTGVFCVFILSIYRKNKSHGKHGKL
jgi:hypothetical protein